MSMSEKMTETAVGMPDFDVATYKMGDPYEGDWQPTAECGWAGARTRDYGTAKAELDAHAAAAHPVQRELAGQFYAYAEKHYSQGGWDVVVECWTLPEITEAFASEGVETMEQALACSLAGAVDVWADRQADARVSAGLCPECSYGTEQGR
jgi:hypothetical protein